MTKRILITGVSGFIGSHLCAHLLRNTDWDIAGIDGLNYAADVSRLTDMECYDPKRVKLYYHDLRAPLPDGLVERLGRVDFIANLASNSHVSRSLEDPVSFVNNNVQLMLNVMEYARRAKPQTVLHFSTDEVYGAQADGCFAKEWDVHYPSSPYSASKSCQESIGFAYWRSYGVPLIVSNCMNVIGEMQDREKFVPLAIKCLLDGKPVPVHGELVDGKWESGSRCWLHARNCADAVLFILLNVKPVSFPESLTPHKFNIVGDEMTNLGMVELVAKELGREVKFKWTDFHSERPGHDRRYALDGSKLRGLGWTPPLSLEDSLAKTVEWTRRQYVERFGMHLWHPKRWHKRPGKAA